MSTQSSKVFSSLPRYLTRFIGREREIAQLKQLLNAKRAARLITLIGVGGCGKTRLAADLGLREATGRSPARALLAALRQTHLLLVLDNCEHLADACGALVQRLLTGCPGLVIMATSRTPLNVAEESVFPIPPLKTVDVGVGATGIYLAQGEAVRLFLDRAAMMLPGYKISFHNAEAINQICHRLDGLPLAIELAASWIRVLSAQDILRQVERSLDFLSSSEPTLARRHRSMRVVLDTSWRRREFSHKSKRAPRWPNRQRETLRSSWAVRKPLVKYRRYRSLRRKVSEISLSN